MINDEVGACCHWLLDLATGTVVPPNHRPMRGRLRRRTIGTLFPSSLWGSPWKDDVF